MIEPVAKVLRGSLKADWRDRLEAARADIRDLGFGLPLRAGYELSKKVGTHGLVFGALERRSPRPAPMPAFRPIDRVPQDAQQRTLEAADRVIGGEVVLFGKALPTSATTPWDAYIEKPGHWPRDEWWKLDIRSAARDADVKWTWELGRQRHLVLLARAAHLRPERDEYRRVLVEGLTSFIAEAPPERGIHWYSNLEVALHILRWQEILDLVDVDSDLRRTMLVTMAHARRHLIADLPYTVSTMRNNHLLGDTLGILATSPNATAGLASAMAKQLFEHQLANEMRTDGSLIEDSVSYHRFVLEMLAWRLRATHREEATQAAAVRAAQHLARLGVFEGEVPQYGDWDGGRVLCAADDASSLAGSAAAALALSGSGAPAEWRERWDECAWYAQSGNPIPPEKAVTDGSDVGGGIARAVQGDFTLWLKAGSGQWHGHADLCSTAIRTDAGWLIGDPGTGTYNGDPAVRDYFRSTQAHNTLAVGGEDQFRPHRTFRWRHTGDGAIGRPVQGPDWTLLWGAHNAYARLDSGRRVCRTLLLRPSGVVVAEWIEGPWGAEWTLTFALGPSTAYEPRNGLRLGDRRYPFLLPGSARIQTGLSDPPVGWWSSDYGTWQPSTQVSVNGRYKGPIVWGMGEAALATTFGQEVQVGEIRWSITWEPSGPILSMSKQSGVIYRSLALAL